MVLLRDRVTPYRPPAGAGRFTAYLGIDIGSVSTNLVVVDEAGEVVFDSYLRTAGRPVEAVQQGLTELEAAWGERIAVAGVGTTGSGRELVGEFVGADVVNDEITAHKTGAVYVSAGRGGPLVDTIFEIGGQDSKFISLENGVVVDFTMNEACAAGTGSFLEEQADKLGISIKNEFARLALSSPAPTRLGERCTVFMERDVTGWLHKAEPIPNLVAGLAYSIALNYLNRVVRGRHIGEVIYFQGGTAYNDAVAAAFAAILGRTITVPPYNGVMGAIGMALIARNWHRAGRGVTRFRGYDLTTLEQSTRDFVCRSCTNECDIKEFTIEGQKSYWGDKCSDRFRRPAQTARRPVVDDLFEYRDRLLEDVVGPTRPPGERPVPGRISVGIPRTMATLERYPFWHTYLSTAGLQPILSRPTDRKMAGEGIELALAQPCYPVQVAHGHVLSLFEQGVDYVLVPNMLDNESHEDSPTVAHFCPWTQTLPYVLRTAPRIDAFAPRILAPSLHFQMGPDRVKSALAEMAGHLGVRRRASDRAVDAAYAAQRRFQEGLLEAGRRALESLERAGEPGIVLVGRPYNIYDRSINCDIPRKLRRYYGVNVIPIDFLVTGREAVDDLHANMYLDLGPAHPPGGAPGGVEAGLAHHLHLQLQVRARFLHQVLHATGRRSPAPRPVLRRPWQRRRLSDAVRSLPRQQGHSPMHLGSDGDRPARQRADNHPLTGKRVYLPPMAYGSARLFASALRSLGVDAALTPPSDARTRELGAQFTSGDECYPAKVTVGDFMRVLERPDTDPARTVFFMPTADGPCRFGQYAAYMRRLLDAHGYPQVEVLSPTSRNAYGGLGSLARPFVRTAWRALVAADILQKLLLQHRPYERRMGAADATFEECLNEICAAFEKGPSVPAEQLRRLRSALVRCRLRFIGLDTRPDPSRPLIGVVGEIFCRLNTFSNEDAVRRLEQAGAEVWLSGITEWIWYTVSEQYRKLRLHGKTLSMETASTWLREKVQHHDEQVLLDPFRSDFAGYEEPGVDEVVEVARPYLPQDGALGEMVLSVGRAIRLADRGVDGIIDISPFTCMNGIVCEAVYPRVSRDLNGLPIRTLYFDGTPQDLESDLGVYLNLARSYQQRKKVPRPPVAPLSRWRPA